jgi:hypothetical protein
LRSARDDELAAHAFRDDLLPGSELEVAGRRDAYL